MDKTLSELSFSEKQSVKTRTMRRIQRENWITWCSQGDFEEWWKKSGKRSGVDKSRDPTTGHQNCMLVETGWTLGRYGTNKKRLAGCERVLGSLTAYVSVKGVSHKCELNRRRNGRFMGGEDEWMRNRYGKAYKFTFETDRFRCR